MRTPFYQILILLFSCSSPHQHPPGGYPYPEKVRAADTDYYFLPIRKFLPGNDSLLYANGNYLFRMFHEPNLGIRYLGHEEYRLTYESALFYPTIIVLTPGKIVVKHETGGLPYPPENEDLLDSLDPHAASFTYYERTYPITDSQYRYLTNLIDSSGYWHLPYSIGCKPENIPMDGDGFTLEANIRDRYNIVSRPRCAADSGRALASACQQLVKFAHKDDSIVLIDDSGSRKSDTIKFITVPVQMEDVHAPRTGNIPASSTAKKRR